MNNEYIVSGIMFNTEIEYKKALNDEKHIAQINEKIDLTNHSKVRKLYIRLLEKQTFKTAVGFVYLKKLYDIIKQDSQDEVDELPIINIDMFGESETVDYGYFSTGNKNNGNVKKIKNENMLLKGIIVILLICVASMFVITMKSDSLTYSRARESVIDEYEEWQNELEKREQEIEKRETELEKTP